MKINDIIKEVDRVFKYLDSIDILSELNDTPEDIYEFRDRLELKYPYKTEMSDSLFVWISMEEFEDYLYKRFNGKGYRISEETYKFISK